MSGAKSVKMAEKEQLIIDYHREEGTPKPKVTRATEPPPLSCCEAFCLFMVFVIGLACFAMGLSGLGGMFWNRPTSLSLKLNVVNDPPRAPPTVADFFGEWLKASGTNPWIFNDDADKIMDKFELKLNQSYGTTVSTIIKLMGSSLKDLRKQLHDCRLGVNPLNYSDPERQIISKLKAEGSKLLNRICIEYQINKSNSSVLPCRNAESAFLGAQRELSRIGGAGWASYECNYTLQMDLDEAAAVWTNKSCKTVLRNGLVYHEITQVTYKREVKTMDDKNFGTVRKDMETWCACVKRADHYYYSSYRFDDCLDNLGYRTTSQALIKGMGYQRACSNPGEVMLGDIPWKKYP